MWLTGLVELGLSSRPVQNCNVYAALWFCLIAATVTWQNNKQHSLFTGDEICFEICSADLLKHEQKPLRWHLRICFPRRMQSLSETGTCHVPHGSSHFPEIPVPTTWSAAVLAVLFVLLCGGGLKELCWLERWGVGTLLHSVSLEDFQSHVPGRKIEWTLAPEINTTALLHSTETQRPTWFRSTHTVSLRRITHSEQSLLLSAVWQVITVCVCVCVRGPYSEWVCAVSGGAALLGTEWS